MSAASPLPMPPRSTDTPSGKNTVHVGRSHRIDEQPTSGAETSAVPTCDISANVRS